MVMQDSEHDSESLEFGVRCATAGPFPTQERGERRAHFDETFIAANRVTPSALKNQKNDTDGNKVVE